MGKFTTLERASLTQNWSLEERSALGHFLEEKSLGEGQTLFAAQGRDRGLYLLDSGSIRLSFENFTVDLKPGDSFGEISLLYPTQKLVSALALKESTLWMMSVENWSHLSKMAPVVSLKLLESITQKLAKVLNDMVPPPKLFASPVAGALSSAPPPSFKTS